MKAFKAFVVHCNSSTSPITDATWVTITPDEFDDYRISPDYVFRSTSTVPTPVAPRSADPVREFKRGIKRDISHFISLKDDGAWDNWNRATLAQARAQDVDEVLSPSYVPTSALERELFNEKQKYMYAVFEKTLLTDKGNVGYRVN